MKLEEMFSQIEEIIAKMEDPEVLLDESFALYQSGVEKLKECNHMLDEVEKNIQVLNADGTMGELD